MHINSVVLHSFLHPLPAVVPLQHRRTIVIHGPIGKLTQCMLVCATQALRVFLRLSGITGKRSHCQYPQDRTARAISTYACTLRCCRATRTKGGAIFRDGPAIAISPRGEDRVAPVDWFLSPARLPCLLITNRPKHPIASNIAAIGKIGQRQKTIGRPRITVLGPFGVVTFAEHAHAEVSRQASL